VNQYRMWVNGAALPAAFVPGQPRAYHDYGFNDSWTDFQLREGWNHLVFEFDTTTRPKDVTFRFGVPEGIKSVICSAAKPADMGKAAESTGSDHFPSSCWQVRSRRRPTTACTCGCPATVTQRRTDGPRHAG